ncbi:MAG: SDR family oxidoreductase [Thermoguttaceae bacterium]|jgi:pteridine reductase|nr:SDR family oxidoreductase [Thermoguttaceae bacterium]
MVATDQNPVALVTGAGSRRVGRAVATALAARGYDIALHYRTAAAEAAEALTRLRQHGVRAEGFQADLAVETEVNRLFRDVAEHFGRLDALVTCAAVWEPKPLETTTADDVRRQFEINALATFLCCRQAGLIMVRQPKGGAIVTIADWAIARPYSGYPAYFLSKGAIPTMTRMFAVELAQRNPRIRVNCILPGPVMLPDDLPAEERAAAIAGTLVQREGRPEDVAHAALFLIENEFVTGVCLPVDGGRTIAPYRA